MVGHYLQRLLEDPHIKFFISVVGSIICFLFGELDMAAKLFIFLLITDLLTGIAKALKCKVYSSNILRRSILKVVEYGLAIFVGHMGEQIGITGLRSLVLFWAALTELSSIIENFEELGINLPPFITDKLLQTKKKKFGG